MKEFVINVAPLETRIALLEDKRLAELTVERHESRSLVGNIYKGRVDSIVPGIQAAFIDIGFEKNGFLYVSDIAGPCLLYTSEAADDLLCVDLGGRRLITTNNHTRPTTYTIL